MKTVDYLNVGFDEVLNIDVVLVIPKRIDGGFSETQPRKVNEELRWSELTQKSRQVSAIMSMNHSQLMVQITCMAGMSGT